MMMEPYRKLTLVIIATAAIISVYAVSIGEDMFGSHIQNDIDRLYAASKNISQNTFTHDKTHGLPEPLQRYFKFALQDGQHYISYVKLKHNGTFRQDEGQGWMPIDGREFFTTENPGFVWFAKIKPFPLFWISGKDTYIEGKGNLQIKIMSLFTVADAKGKETDEGELLRWLAEAPWFPTALLPSKYLHWEEIDSSSAKAVVKYGGLTVSAIFHFNEKGEIIKLNADRYKTVGKSFSKEKWICHFRDYELVNNIMIPKENEAAWKSNNGESSYAKFRILDIEFDTKPSV
jgi:hypothetical protein